MLCVSTCSCPALITSTKSASVLFVVTVNNKRQQHADVMARVQSVEFQQHMVRSGHAVFPGHLEPSSTNMLSASHLGESCTHMSVSPAVGPSLSYESSASSSSKSWTLPVWACSWSLWTANTSHLQRLDSIRRSVCMRVTCPATVFMHMRVTHHVLVDADVCHSLLPLFCDDVFDQDLNERIVLGRLYHSKWVWVGIVSAHICTHERCWGMKDYTTIVLWISTLFRLRHSLNSLCTGRNDVSIRAGYIGLQLWLCGFHNECGTQGEAQVLFLVVHAPTQNEPHSRFRNRSCCLYTHSRLTTQ